MAKEHKYVYTFGAGKAEGDASMRNLLGGKGANLAEMCNIGLPVPAGFTISTDVCTYYYANDRSYPKELKKQVETALVHVEKIMGAEFGSAKNPLLVSCRSGARESMPGMMDTVLNIGLNEKTLEALARQSQNERFAWDSYRRFVQMYGDVVLDMKPKDKRDADPFEMILEEVKHKANVQYDSELSVDQLKNVVIQFKKMVKEQTGKEFPTEPMEQVWGADRGRLWKLDERPGRRLPPPIQHSPRVGDRDQCAGDGLRQPGRRLRHGRRPDARLRLGAPRLQRRLPC